MRVENSKVGEVINDDCYRRHRRHDSRKSSRRKKEPLPSFEGTMIDISNDENVNMIANKEEVILEEALSKDMEYDDGGDQVLHHFSPEEEKKEQRQDAEDKKSKQQTTDKATSKKNRRSRNKIQKQSQQQLITKEDAQIQHLSKLQYLVQKFNNSVTKHRMENLDKLCECLDHSSKELHSLEIQMGVPHILYQKLVFVLSLNNTLVMADPPATATERLQNDHNNTIRKPRPRYPLPSGGSSVSSLQKNVSTSNIASTTTTATNPTASLMNNTATLNLEEEISMLCCAFEMIYCRSSSTDVIRQSLKDNSYSMVSLFIKLLHLYIYRVIATTTNNNQRNKGTSTSKTNDVQVIGAPLSFSSTTSSCSIDTTYFDEPSAPIGEDMTKQNAKVDVVDYEDEDESEVLLFSPSRRVKRQESTDDEEHDDVDKRDDDEYQQHRRRHRTRGEEEDEYYEDHYRNHRRSSSRSSLNKANKESVLVEDGIGVVGVETGTGTSPSSVGASSNNNNADIILIFSTIQSLLKVCCTFVQMGDPMEFRTFIIGTENHLFLSTIQSLLLKWKRRSNQQQRNKSASSRHNDDAESNSINDIIAYAFETIGYFASEDDNEEECSSEILLTLLDHKWNFVDHILWYATRSSSNQIRTKASFAMMNVISRTHKSHFSTRQTNQILDSLLIVLEDSQKLPRKYAGASLFNLAYGGHYHVELVTYQNGAFLTALEHILSSDKDKKSRSNAAWVLFYLVNHHDHDGNHKSTSNTSDIVRRTISSKESLLMLLATLVKQDHSLIKVPAAKTLRVLSETITPNDIPCHSILLQALRHAAATTTTTASE